MIGLIRREHITETDSKSYLPSVNREGTEEWTVWTTVVCFRLVSSRSQTLQGTTTFRRPLADEQHPAGLDLRTWEKDILSLSEDLKEPIFPAWATAREESMHCNLCGSSAKNRSIYDRTHDQKILLKYINQNVVSELCKQIYIRWFSVVRPIKIALAPGILHWWLEPSWINIQLHRFVEIILLLWKNFGRRLERQRIATWRFRLKWVWYSESGVLAVFPLERYFLLKSGKPLIQRYVRN